MDDLCVRMGKLPTYYLVIIKAAIARFNRWSSPVVQWIERNFDRVTVIRCNNIVSDNRQKIAARIRNVQQQKQSALISDQY